MTLLKTLRDTAMSCSNKEYQAFLRWSADEVEMRIVRLNSNPTKENMQALNGAWAHAERVLSNVPPEAPPAPLAGSPEAARLAA